MHMFSSVIFLVFLSQVFAWFQKNKDSISSYTNCFKSEFKHGKVLQTLKGPHSKTSCAMYCLRNSFCTTAIIDEREDICFLSKLSERDEEEMKKTSYSSSNTNARFSHIKMLGPVVGQGFVPYKNRVFRNCKALKILHPRARSGVYWIRPIHPSVHKPFQAYCDQKTAGGGWTLVWTYTFTDYENFDSVSNAVTPLPNWKARMPPPRRHCQRSSETTPLSEEQTGAMFFPLWSRIGKEFLIKSNIMNWISCLPQRGNLVEDRYGSIKCRVVRNLIGRCGDVVPTLIMRKGPMCGPKLVLGRRKPNPPRCSTTFIDFNGDLKKGWPVHDSCGTCGPTQLKDVAMPRGNVFIR